MQNSFSLNRNYMCMVLSVVCLVDIANQSKINLYILLVDVESKT